MTANPKDIDFVGVGTKVKNKIPEAAIKAFKAKVPGAQAKPFEFAFDKEYETGKLRIGVKQLGFVHEWVDQTFMANKSKMISVEVDIEVWGTGVQKSIDALGKIWEEKEKLGKRAETLAGVKEADAAMVKEQQAMKQRLFALMEEAKKVEKGLVDFWNGGPNEGVNGLMKKHGIPAEQIGGERTEALRQYGLLQQRVKKFQDLYKALGSEGQALLKRLDEVGMKLWGNAKRDRASELADLEEEIQKRIGDFQGYTNSDFAGVGAKALVKEAKEFMGKAGAAWTKLSGNPGELEKRAGEVQAVFERLRILGGRVVTEYQAFQKPSISRSGEMPKYQQMLKMVYDEYMGEHTLTQNTLRSYREALLKQKPKAVELVAKQVKVAAKAEAKQVKSEAKVARKGK
jgi:hypothetical protein